MSHSFVWISWWGSSLSLEPSLQRATMLFLAWVLYTPAITFLALSGYRWQRSTHFGSSVI